MPELPEVETLRLQLTDVLFGLTIKKIEIIKDKSFVGDPKEIIGKKIRELRRFAKILVFDLTGDLSIAIHLKLSGQLIYRGKRQPQKIVVTDPLLKSLPNKHTRVIITFENSDILYFNDLRIFGWMKVIQSNQLINLVQNLGPEPLKDLTYEKFEKILDNSRKPVKLVLMDQEKIAGVGNIYANDALFLAGISPKTEARKISKEKAKLLYDKLLKVLKDGIKWGGASENNFRDAFGQMGRKQEHFYVYGKKSEKCLNNCGEKIRRITLGGRGTFFCPLCQKY
ncbi:DNA-formamidopyrimidine glycosylase [Candidatus Gottesmanbacteria bacterium RIFCSPLOWO2_01_FULL_39_12b]|uniref:DNA-formamidopyrimidine glycosylase n=1 Tax=Candidatus Gottesmanbacteria bacterium RIFCSPLOWO2_01_FULL_39_12b TaxID=1798388 RepID=A0A1F6AMM6_9BACT|nr:MAG: DNA-formamidopyrimidine glycosylase [Candidatus Gottesmanbacteria bacterium RIFCSPLOWO2_01_FULL_39_12b]